MTTLPLLTLDVSDAELMQMVLAGQPLLAPARERPCELYKFHAPAVVITEGHHIHPIFMQNRVFGRIRDNELKWLCGNCHDAVHAWLYWLLGERRKPNPEPGRKAKAEAVRTLSWYLDNGGVIKS